MANVSEKYGLRPYRKLDGTPLVGAQNRYTIASGYATAIYQGDLVEPLASGNIQKHGANTSDAVVGVFNGCFYTDPTTQKPTWKNYYPGSVTASDITAFIVDDPELLLEQIFLKTILLQTLLVLHRQVYPKHNLMLVFQELRQLLLFKQSIFRKIQTTLTQLMLMRMYLLE